MMVEISAYSEETSEFKAVEQLRAQFMVMFEARDVRIMGRLLGCDPCFESGLVSRLQGIFVLDRESWVLY
jgi:hypothetical protein